MQLEQLNTVQAVRIRDDLLATVAHDLKTPISTVITAATLLDDQRLDYAQRRHFIEMIQRSTNHIKKLIDDLVDVAAVEAGRLRLDLDVQPVGTILDAVWEAFESQARKAGLQLTCDCAGAWRFQVRADHDRLFQVLGNLVSNAIKFTQPGGSIKVRTCADDHDVWIAVIDTGAGIAPDELPHVFERFWQAGHQRRAGAGLGLAIARGIVEAHGGKIGVWSRLGVGSMFYFSLPRV